MEKERITQERLDEMLEQTDCDPKYKTLVIDADDTFGFKCQRCGDCCMNRNDIILNPFDVYTGARYLGIRPVDFIEKYTYGAFGGHSKTPMVLLKSQDNGYCPLLELDPTNGLFGCKINDAKPGACSNHPIGVMFQKDFQTNEVSGYQFIKVSQCDNSRSNEMHVVKDWTKRYIDNAEQIQLAFEMQGVINEFFDPRLFYAFFMTIVDTFSMFDILGLTQNEQFNEALKDGTEIKEDAKFVFEKYVRAIYTLYFDYDISQEFIPQAQQHLKEIREFLAATKEIYDNFKTAIESLFGVDIEKLITLEEGESENERHQSI